MTQRFLCYDNGGETRDRYTVVYLDQVENKFKRLYGARAMCSNPTSPQGIGCYTSAQPGRHLGKKISFSNLPVECQKLVLWDLE